MLRPRHSFRLGASGESAGTSGPPDIRSLIPEWHDDAACAKEPDDELVDKAFFVEMALFSQNSDQALVSPLTMYAMLVCETCPVRRPCLRAALDPPHWTTKEGGRRGLMRDDRESTGRVMGVWGGTVELERHLLRDLPVDEAIEILEATFPERLQRRLDVYMESRAKPLDRRMKSGELAPRPVRKVDRRIDELLEKRQVKTSQVGVGKPGPGRGRKGPIAEYAERHRVSRSTAWRRLRAAA